jgi:hypothetical protein
MICEHLYAAYIYMADVRVNHLASMAQTAREAALVQTRQSPDRAL